MKIVENTDKGIWYKVYGKKGFTQKVKDGENPDLIDYIKIDGKIYDIELKPFRMSNFNYDGERICKMCGRGYPCICGDKGSYCAHCMYCNWSLSQDGHMGSKETNKETYEEAKKAWNELNYIPPLPPRKPRKRKETE